MKLSIEHNFPEVQRRLDGLRKDVAERALASAINKTMAQAKTQMSRGIRDEFNISAAKVNATLRVNRASFRSGLFAMSASLESPWQRGRALNVINFDARQTKQGVSVKIKKGGARKTLQSAFIANKGRTVFVRVGRERLPIKAIQTIAVPQMFNTRRINSKVVEFMEQKFQQVFDNEARYFVNRFNAS